MKTCESCTEPGEYLGQVTRYEAGKRPKRIMRNMCKAHYLENEFGLWPFRCTKACTKARAKQVDVPLDPKDTIIWIQLEAVLRKPRPKCPFCGKTMRWARVQR